MRARGRGLEGWPKRARVKRAVDAAVVQRAPEPHRNRYQYILIPEARYARAPHTDTLGTGWRATPTVPNTLGTSTPPTPLPAGVLVPPHRRWKVLYPFPVQSCMLFIYPKVGRFLRRVSGVDPEMACLLSIFGVIRGNSRS